MSSPPENLPSPPSQAVGQQTSPSTIVPHTPNIVPKQHNGLAMVSLVTGILSYLGHIIPFVGGSILAIVAIVTGVIARNQIQETGEEGRTAATIGIVLGVVNLALVAVIVLIVIVLIFFLGFTVLGVSATHR
ncbi:MAG TPA: DUF4190 domain-containing protein [Candidatus Dormibacteraeota bacterium]|nr:DUF4190 domain-containing protein [Candidatus Dormibacteraeota bacterium]